MLSQRKYYLTTEDNLKSNGKSGALKIKLNRCLLIRIIRRTKEKLNGQSEIWQKSLLIFYPSSNIGFMEDWMNGEFGLTRRDFIGELKIAQTIFMLRYEADLTPNQPPG